MTRPVGLPELRARRDHLPSPRIRRGHGAQVGHDGGAAVMSDPVTYGLSSSKSATGECHLAVDLTPGHRYRADRQGGEAVMREDVRIGDHLIDGDGVRWSVLNRPDGSGVCDGLYLAADGRQRYGEHMVAPLLYVRDFGWAGELAECLPTDAAPDRQGGEAVTALGYFVIAVLGACLGLLVSWLFGFWLVIPVCFIFGMVATRFIMEGKP